MNSSNIEIKRVLIMKTIEKAKSVRKSEKPEIVDRIIGYVEENLDQELALDHIEQEFNYSKYYLNRLFAEQTGMTLHKYITRRRLTEAARKLAETKEAITEIAYEAGYTSQQAFTLAFHQLYQSTPRGYRRQGEFYPRQSRIQLVHQVIKSGGHGYSGWRMAA